MKSKISMSVFIFFLSGFFIFTYAQSKLIYINQRKNIVYGNLVIPLSQPISGTHFSVIKNIGNYYFFFNEEIASENLRLRNYFSINKSSHKLTLFCRQSFITKDLDANIYIHESTKKGVVATSLNDRNYHSITCEITKFSLLNNSMFDFYNGQFVLSDFESIYTVFDRKKLIIAEASESIKFGNSLLNPTFSISGDYLTYIEQKSKDGGEKPALNHSYERIIHFYDFKNRKQIRNEIKFQDIDIALLNDCNMEILILTKENKIGLRKIFVLNLITNKIIFIDYGYSAGWF